MVVPCLAREAATQQRDGAAGLAAVRDGRGRICCGLDRAWAERRDDDAAASTCGTPRLGTRRISCSASSDQVELHPVRMRHGRKPVVRVDLLRWSLMKVVGVAGSSWR